MKLKKKIYYKIIKINVDHQAGSKLQRVIDVWTTKKSNKKPLDKYHMMIHWKNQYDCFINGGYI